MKRWATSAAWAALITATATVAVYLGVPIIVARSENTASTDLTTQADPTTLAEPAATPPVSAPARTAGPSAAALWDPLTQGPGVLDPAELPLRRVGQAAFLAAAYGTTWGGILALDAASGEWVRADAPWLDGSQPVLLSPDGRTVVQIGSRATTMNGQPIGRKSEIQVISLSTGSVRAVDAPLHRGEFDCDVNSVAWAPDAALLGVVSSCLIYVPGTTPADHEVIGGSETWVDEIDLSTGASRVIEHRPDTYPSEAYPSYSPDGRLLAYGIGPASPAEGTVRNPGAAVVRVIGLDQATSHEWPNMHMVYGDPWRDGHSLLVWDESALVGSADAYRLLDAETGESAPLGIARLTNVSGFVAGALLVERTDWLQGPVPCSVSLCLADVSTGDLVPWLPLPENDRIGFVGTARALVARPSD